MFYCTLGTAYRTQSRCTLYNQTTMYSIYYWIVLLALLMGKISTTKSPFPPDNAKMNLLVAVDKSIHDLPHSNTKFIVELKALLFETSELLFIATKRVLYLDHVTVLLPSSWENQFVDSIYYATHETYEAADIKIEDLKPGKNSLPYTVRSEGCGRPGKTIYVPPSFITKSAKEKDIAIYAKLLLRELAYYQFGIFDECGYENNALYPPFYYQNDERILTGCVNDDIVGVIPQDCDDYYFIRSRSNSECAFNVDANKIKQPSLIYQPTWKTANLFCDEDTHNSEAPTKQNILCGEKSVMEIIRSALNYVKLTVLTNTTNRSPKFKIIIESKPQYTVLLDESQARKSNDKLNAINKALRHFITHDVPVNSSLGFATISSVFTVRRNVTTIIDDKSRNHVKNALPDNVHVSSEANIEEGIKGSSEMFMPQRRGVIILIITGRWVLPDVDNLCNVLKTRKIRLQTILCLDSQEDINQQALDDLQRLRSCSHGKVFVIPESSDGNQPMFLERTKLALRESIQLDDIEQQRVQIMEKYIINSTTPILTGTFRVDNSIATNSKSTFRVTYHVAKNVKSVTLRHEDGTSYDDNYVNVYSKNISIPEIVYNFNTKTGIWNYKIDLYEQLKDYPLVLTAFSEVNSRATIYVNVWTNSENRLIDATKMAVVIYAEVKQGHKIIADAEVKAVIYSPDQKSKFFEVELFDDGNGDPDITKNDGIYSRYFTNLKKSGFYAVFVKVNGIFDKTKVLEEELFVFDHQTTVTCKDMSYQATDTGKFERHAIGSSFYVQKEIQSDKDIYPPSRITDLRVVDMSYAMNIIMLQWTSPGDDYDTGIVSNYEVRYSVNRSHLQENQFINAKLLADLQIAIRPGRVQTHVRVKLPEGNVSYYVAMRTRDEEKNTSPVSNIVSVYFSSRMAEQYKNIDEFLDVKTSGILTGIGVGVLVMIISFLIILRIIYGRQDISVHLRTWRIHKISTDDKQEISKDGEESNSDKKSLNSCISEYDNVKTAKYDLQTNCDSYGYLIPKEMSAKDKPRSSTQDYSEPNSFTSSSIYDDSIEALDDKSISAQGEHNRSKSHRLL